MPGLLVSDASLVCVHSFVQAAAAAQAGVSVIQPNVGRIGDYYIKNPGAIRDHKVRAGLQGSGPLFRA